MRLRFLRVVENHQAVFLFCFVLVILGFFLQFIEVFIVAYDYRRIRIPKLAALGGVPRF